MSRQKRGRRRTRQAQQADAQRLSVHDLLWLAVGGPMPAPRTADERLYANCCHMRRYARLVTDPHDRAQFVAWRDFDGGWPAWFEAYYSRPWAALVQSVRLHNPQLFEFYSVDEVEIDKNGK